LEERECHIYIILGRQGVGKTYRLLQECITAATGDRVRMIKPRKVLIFDCNVISGSYKDIKTIDFNSYGKTSEERCAAIKRWTRPDIRRVINYCKDRKLMNLDQMNETALDLMEHFSNGMLCLEDMNVYLHGSQQKRFLSEFVRVRHKSVDLAIVVQSFRVIDPKMWSQCSLLRMHKTFDNVDAIKDKIPDQYEMLKIAQLIVNNEYQKGNQRFFLYVNMRNGKIIGAKEHLFVEGCRNYLALNNSEINELSKIKKIKAEQAIEMWIEMKKKEYFNA
jgi:hypothetical protein